jgi:hypothetical protein
VSQAAVKARLWRVRLELRDRLNEYLSERTESLRPRILPRGAGTQRIIGLFAECLRNSIPRTRSFRAGQLTTSFVTGESNHSPRV